MSRAFVKETDASAPPPERMVAEGCNPVTRAGYARIATEVARLEVALKGGPDALLRETLERDLRYWAVKKASAEIVAPPTGDAIAFGHRVTLARGAGGQAREQIFRIVGEDEADPPRGLVSIRSPLAQAILGARVGDVIEAAAPLGEIAIRAIEA
ncbi:MAG TPA: GreA/GreB family elongation factor [Rhizomicrobium sp.]|nr:GreA/GreB family elongation factor [Rhizomicrobium sp.]